MTVNNKILGKWRCGHTICSANLPAGKQKIVTFFARCSPSIERLNKGGLF
jgi:hypothetical protein